MLGAMAVLQAVSLGPLAHKYLILQRLRDDSSYAVTEMQLSDAISQAVTYLTAGFFLTTVSCFLIWQYRCVRNLPALGIADRRLSPGWSVGGWFVPVVNLIHGYRVMSELWRTSALPGSTSDRAGAPVTRLVLAWWVSYLGGGMLGLVSGLPMRGLPPAHRDYAYQLQNSILLQGAGALALAVSAVLLLLLIRRIERRQHDRVRTRAFD